MFKNYGKIVTFNIKNEINLIKIEIYKIIIQVTGDEP